MVENKIILTKEGNKWHPVNKIKQIYQQTNIPSKKIFTKFVHQQLPSGSMNFGTLIIYQYFQKRKSKETCHDYFLQYPESTAFKRKTINFSRDNLTTLNIPEQLVIIAISELRPFYNHTRPNLQLLNIYTDIRKHQKSIG